MSTNITIAALIAGISGLSNDKYAITLPDNSSDELLALCPETLTDKTVLRLSRLGSTYDGPKTLIVAVVQEKEQLQYLLHWCALVRETLTDPQASDLYAFAIRASEFNSLDDCLNFESSESYCRKYITRPDENAETLLLRTFLAPTEEVISSATTLSDPLTQALADTAKNYPWMNETETEKWRTAFLTGKSGLELIELLFSDPSKPQQTNIWNI